MSQPKTRERIPTGRRGRPSKSMIAAALGRPFCSYLHKLCLNNRLEGQKYCIDHILCDRSAPFRQCTFVHHLTGRRCTRAAHKVDRKTCPLCRFHKVIPKVQTTATGLPELNTVSSGLLEDLSHHGDEHRVSFNTFWITKADRTIVASPKLRQILDTYNAERSATDVKITEFPTMEEIAARHNTADSETESVDKNLDLFDHTSVFTDEEVTRILRDKMVRLRRLYIEQYGYIQYILKEKRLKYIQAQREESTCVSNIDVAEYQKLKAMLRYNKSFGQDYLLYEQAKRRKLSHGPAKNLQPQEEQPIKTVCIFSKTVHGCDKPNLPLSPYCLKHILYDTKQVLFRPCAAGNPPCLTPVTSFTRKNICPLHLSSGSRPA